MLAFTVHDKKSGGWNYPFPSANRSTAMRQMTHDLQKQESLLRSYAEDFSLNETGEFDEHTGRLTGLADPVFICDLSDLLEESPIQ